MSGLIRKFEQYKLLSLAFNWYKVCWISYNKFGNKYVSNADSLYVRLDDIFEKEYGLDGTGVKKIAIVMKSWILTC